MLTELDPGTLSDEELGDVLVRWQRAEARLTASRSRLIAAFDIRRVWRGNGSKSAAGWLARAGNASLQVMRGWCRLARRLRHMPVTREALARGDISERHADLLAGLCDSPRKVVADAFPGAEEQLVGYAKDLDFDGFVAAIRYWESIVDQDGIEERAQWDYESRHLNVSQTLGGNYRLDGQLDPVGGTEFTTALRRIEKELFDADWAAAKAEHGDDIRLDDLGRTPGQRRADALAEMARRAMTAPTDRKRPRPLFVIHLGDDSLKRLCELANGKVVAPGLLVPRLGEAEIERIVYAGESRRVVDLGRRTRFFQGALRRAIQLRDRRCVEPGCGIPADECDIDHLDPFSRGGRTDQTNGVARCGHSNRFKSDTLPDDWDPD